MHPIAAWLALNGWEAMTNSLGNAVARCDGTLLRRCNDDSGIFYIPDSSYLDALAFKWVPRDWADVPESDLLLMAQELRKGGYHAP